ncbi:cupredoxin domain-containing protein [Aliikangiella sp. G2MR2-5]|uniref:cupredoxin domain-containing protein n=1 Tax=Aliikangiella sp. G2MR2-5 TaxID=2788943 RepID=UPI001FEEF7D8|nr:cupredoxin domain-containing protein [Aliikangiella sp. G2MR2-5]
MMIMVNILGLLLIALIVYWFWIYREKDTQVSENSVLILVENGIYQPSRITFRTGQPFTLNFKRIDESPCAAMLLIPALEISQELTLGKITPLELPALEKGEYEFHCQMQMYRGTLIVEK